MDLFGREKRKAERIKKYKDHYRGMNPSQRVEQNDFLKQMAIHATFRNNAVAEQLTAAAAVEREEAITGLH